MLRSLILFFAKKKNPDFTLDASVSGALLARYAWNRIWAFMRGFRLLRTGRIPKGLFLGRGVSTVNLRNIRFGRMVQIHEYTRLSAIGKGPLEIGNQVTIGAFSRIAITYGFHQPGVGIRIGNNVGIGEYTHLGGAGGLEIGDDCIVGPYFSCHPENHETSQPGVPYRLQGVNRKGIRIGKNCWVGAKVTVLDGVEVGDNCILAAGAVVTKSFPANSLIGGVPARLIKQLPTQA
ncbi:MAG: acyltransferase [Bacteroidia bacterium]